MTAEDVTLTRAIKARKQAATIILQAERDGRPGTFRARIHLDLLADRPDDFLGWILDEAEDLGVDIRHATMWVEHDHPQR